MLAPENCPLVSVVILNWNGKNFLNSCVKSVLETDYPTDLLEVIVVDNGSTDGSAKSLKKMFPQVKLVENERNLGFCVGNNMGVKHASGNLLVLLNNDTIVNKNWVNEILKSAKDPKIGIVGCRLYFPGTRIIQSIGYRMIFIGYWESIGAGKENSDEFTKVGDVDFVCGAAMAVKKKVIETIGLFDPEFYAYAEDLDLCYRARKAGYRVVTSGAIVYHYGSVSWDHFPIKKAYLFCRNHLYFILKHYSPKVLLRYVFEYPIRSFKVDLCRFIRGKTVLQIVTISNRKKRWRNIFKSALNILLLKTITFFVALLNMVIRRKIKTKFSTKR
jgi:GT2 family glycosyltransferase